MGFMAALAIVPIIFNYLSDGYGSGSLLQSYANFISGSTLGIFILQGNQSSNT